MKPTLILDIDGVVLRWSSQLVAFLETVGPVNPDLKRKVLNNEYLDLSFMGMDAIFDYHRSVFIERLDPLESCTTSTIQALAANFNLVALTSFSADPQAQDARKRNLAYHFPNCFEEIVILPTLAAKKTELVRLAGKYNVIGFVDDSPKHIEESLAVLGYDRTFWLNTFKHAVSLPCQSLQSLSDICQLVACHIPQNATLSCMA